MKQSGQSLEAEKAQSLQGVLYAVLWQLNAACCGWVRSPVLRKEEVGRGAGLFPCLHSPPSPRCACP